MPKLKRFPNPGSDINMFISIFKKIFPILSKKRIFSLYDMELSMIKNSLVSSEGFTGMKAFQLSLRDDASRDPIYNQAKMYAELYRMLGWFSSSNEKNLLFTITELGRAIATNNVDNHLIFKECILGIVDENEIISKKDGLEMRPFKYILNVLSQMSKKICKLELIYGPYRYPDKEIDVVIKVLKENRGNLVKLLENISQFSKESAISQVTMENYTRFPIAVLEYLGWISKENSNELYPGSKNMVVMNMTNQGQKDLDFYNSLIDIRYSDFLKLSEEMKISLIRVAYFQQLERMNIKNNTLNISHDVKKLEEVYGLNPQFLFSPYQMLNNDFVDKALYIEKLYSDLSLPIEKKELLISIESFNNITEKYVTEIKFKSIFHDIEESDKNTEIYKEIVAKRSKTENQIVNELMSEYGTANKEVFYPLIGDIFNILGFNCRVSRNGTNYERYDAIIVGENSIPLEIKSPGEEINISVKAVRQALENKIILLSRKTFQTEWATTSLVVGYNLPNDRAEVITLIDDIKKTFNLNIGILNFETLLRILINKILYNRIILNDQIIELKGMVTLDEE